MTFRPPPISLFISPPQIQSFFQCYCNFSVTYCLYSCLKSGIAIRYLLSWFVFRNCFCYFLKSVGVIYYEPTLHAIIGNARKNLLTIANAMPALLFSVLRQYWHAFRLLITKPPADLRYFNRTNVSNINAYCLLICIVIPCNPDWFTMLLYFSSMKIEYRSYQFHEILPKPTRFGLKFAATPPAQDIGFSHQ